MAEMLPLVDADQAAAALHGSYCPKMCNFACPVTAATGRDDALPWSFHRTVTDLAEGRRVPSAHTAGQLEACSGCLACQVPCAFDQDVPAQVRAGRRAQRAAGASVAGAEEAVAAVAAGRSPFGLDLPAGDDLTASDVDTLVVAGCRDDADDLAALRRLCEAAGRRVGFVVPDGCCGGVLDDLGAGHEAAAARARLGDRLGTAIADDPTTLVATDPHCLASLREVADDAVDVRDVASFLAGLLEAGDLALAGGSDGEGGTAAVTFHDPCLLARAEDVTTPPRRLLAAAGVELVEPEGAGTHTVCSGAGMALDLVAPDDARATAELRSRQLAATGVPVVTACAGARRRLAASGADVTDLARFLADRLAGDGPAHDRPTETDA